jgi:hypothetical protein
MSRLKNEKRAARRVLEVPTKPPYDFHTHKVQVISK